MEQARLSGHPETDDRIIRFGAFDLCLPTQELRKHGVRIRLQGKPFRILCALLEQPGHVVTREELRARLWSSDTFVDFESGLNTAVNRLRVALGDSADNPSYIETLARIGYRFIADISSEPLGNKVELGASQTAFAPAVSIGLRISDPVISLPEAALHARRRSPWLFAGIVSALSAALAIAWIARAYRPAPSFHQLTFGREYVSNARFSHDGNIIYDFQKSRGHGKITIFDARTSQRRDLASENAWLAALSPNDEALLFVYSEPNRMTLESRPLRGGTPRVISTNAMAADWASNGTLCVVTAKDSSYSIEYPPGKTIYRSRGWIADVRVSPNDKQIAFSEHPVEGDDSGQVMVVSSSGQSRVLSGGWASLQGLAWRPSGREIWFTAARTGVDRAVMAVGLSGKTRQVAQNPGSLRLLDIAPSGNVLLTRTAQEMTMLLGKLDQETAQDISWLDWSRSVAISSDGQEILFDESGAGGGKGYSVYLYKAGPGPPMRLAAGLATDLSPDGHWALTQPASDNSKLSLISVDGNGTSIVKGNGAPYRWVRFFPDGKEILFARYGEASARIYRQLLPDGEPVLVKDAFRMDDPVIDQQGLLAAGYSEDSNMELLNLINGSVRSIAMKKHVYPVSFLDNKHLLVRSMSDEWTTLDSLNLQTGELTSYGEIHTSIPGGLTTVFPMHIAADAQTFVYSRLQSLSDLFLESGWR